MSESLIVGIDATNIRAGGGLTHLACLLQNVNPGEHDISRINVWGGLRTVERLPESEKIKLVHVPLLDNPLPFRIAWQFWFLPRHLKKRRCDVLFSPGGILPMCVPMASVVMSQNLLPFEPQEVHRFGSLSFMQLKMRLVGASQRRSMKQTNGLIFLTQYACDTVTATLKCQPERIAVIPHGIEARFFSLHRQTCLFSDFTKEHPFHLLYVSIIDMYKHQWCVAEAIATLRGKGVPVEIDFVGPAYSPALKKLNAVIKRFDPLGEFLHYRGVVSFSELHAVYRKADAFVFASSCENLPNILLEAMASGLPIACSNRGPMPEVLGDAGVYFDPEKPSEIAEVIRKLMEDSAMRAEKADAARERAKPYTWERCARETFDFIAKAARTQIA